MNSNILRKLAGEFLGTLFLLTIIVGSGIMGDRLSAGNNGLVLLANSIATGCGLIVLIWIFASISGAHFNPVVTMTSYLHGHHTKKESMLYILMQVTGAIAGVVIAHIMFGELLILPSSKDRSGFSQIFSEFIATFGLIMVIRGLSHKHNEKIPIAVGLYIVSAYWFTSSTSFANPAVTLARSLTPTFAGISQGNVLGFVCAQIVGALIAELTFCWFLRGEK